MFKLTVVAGPNRGSSYAVQEGENFVGRQSGNAVVLPSSRVSKRHCVLVANNGELVVKDAGSANGTFVNGVKTGERKVGAGDRISVGEYVLEVTLPSRRARPAGAVQGIGNVVQFPAQYAMTPAHHRQPVPASAPGGDALQGALDPDAMPTELKGRLLWQLDRRVMPFFYGMMLKNQWRIVSLGVFAAFLVLNLVFSVQPLLNSSTEAIVKESKRRAKTMARVLVERNTPFLAAGQETKTEIGFLERDEGVRTAVLVDLDNRIIAPGSRMNQYFTLGAEARTAAKVAAAYRKGDLEKGITTDADENTVVSIEPIKVFDSRSAQNVVVGMAIVSVDTSLATLQMGEIGMVYAEALVFTGLIGLIALAILYKLTLKPLLVLNEDIDKVLKGDMPEVTHEFQFEELNPLWEIVNATLQRVPRGGAGDGLVNGAPSGPTIDDFLGSLKMFGNLSRIGIAVCDQDRRVVHLSPYFEEVTGIRNDNVQGQELQAVANDQAFSSLVADMLGRSAAGSEGVVEDFDFGGVAFKVTATGLGGVGTTPRGFVMALTKAEG
jgi:PAS domain-containing protein